MAGASFRLTGDHKLVAQLGRLSNATRGQAMGDALMAGAEIVSNDAKRRAPYKTGNLRRSIHPRLVSAGASSAEALVGTNVEYAIYQELGTRRMAANPYLRPALESMQGAVSVEVSAALLDLIRGAVR